MINIIRQGNYKLIETKNQIKILYLDDDIYAWPETTKYREMLVVSHRSHKTDALLGMGRYNLYEVEDEPTITDIMHLELEVDTGVWQGYLLLTGLPTEHKTRSRIIPTHEVITGNPLFRYRSVGKNNLVRA